jgi:hypothetical protein
VRQVSPSNAQLLSAADTHVKLRSSVLSDLVGLANVSLLVRDQTNVRASGSFVDTTTPFVMSGNESLTGGAAGYLVVVVSDTVAPALSSAAATATVNAAFDAMNVRVTFSIDEAPSTVL